MFALYEGRLPDPHSWSGFHPPLYYAFGAVLWDALPEAIPVHAALRLLSAAAGFGAIAIAWRALRRIVSTADAAAVAALVASAPKSRSRSSAKRVAHRHRRAKRPRTRDRLAAFVAYPNESARRALEALTRADTGAAPK